MAFIESSLANVKPDDKFQFERNGYIVADLKDHSQEMPVFNLAVTLRSARSASK
jgi:glutaminyl-tRNA synthetase